MRGWGCFFQTQIERDVFMSINDKDGSFEDVELDGLYELKMI